MTAFDNQPQSYDFLSPLNYKFLIKKCPSINFFCQKVNIPGITNNSALSFNPFTKIPYAGDHIEFDVMTAVFKVDEKMQNYLEIFNWIRQLGFPEDWSEYLGLEIQPKATGTGLKSDISILVLDSSKNPIFECLLIDAYPISLSGIQFTSTDADVEFVTCEANFQYTNFRINPQT